MPGCRIGAESIIGVCFVVTKDISTYVATAGIPARVIKKREERCCKTIFVTCF